MRRALCAFLLLQLALLGPVGFLRARPAAGRSSKLARHSVVVSEVTTEVQGEEGTKGYRRYFKAKEKAISPWHDLPLESEAK